jgi:hypothetical protein
MLDEMLGSMKDLRSCLCINTFGMVVSPKMFFDRFKRHPAVHRAILLHCVAVTIGAPLPSINGHWLQATDPDISASDMHL